MTLHPAGTQWMPPSESWESAEVGVGRHHGTAMLHCDRRVLGVGDQLPGGSRLAAQSFEYVQMVGAGTHDARRRAFHERRHECERLVESGWRVEDPGVGHDADEVGRTERGRRGRKVQAPFRPRRQTGDPTRILGVIGDGVLDMRIYQDIYIWKQHLESPTPTLEQSLVILWIERPGPVEVDSGAGTNATHGHQLERRRLRWLATLQSIVQRSGNKGAHADAVGCGCPTHLLCKLVIKRDRRSHDALP